MPWHSSGTPCEYQGWGYLIYLYRGLRRISLLPGIVCRYSNHSGHNVVGATFVDLDTPAQGCIAIAIGHLGLTLILVREDIIEHFEPNVRAWFTGIDSDGDD